MAADRPLILLTGATGFVGRHLMRALAAKGARVRPVVRTGTLNRLPACDAFERVVTSSDIFAEEPEWWAATCRGVDLIVHAAWYAEPGAYLQSPRNLDCLAGTIRLAQAAVEERVPRFVGIGTCFEYDLRAGRLHVDTPLRPQTPYAAAKAAAYLALGQALPQQGVSFAWCRLFYLYGEGEDARRLVPYLRARLAAGEPAELTSGAQVRDFLDVGEAARMVAETALGPKEGPLNICSGVPVSVRELAERIADEYGRCDLLRFGARSDNLTDPPMVVGVR
jgi:dTDP-6-deoxy-L-talose 4-dehydrogenase (NAD+)